MTTTFRTRRLGEMSWTEAREAAAADPVVLLPIGAVEQHGPHLPIEEDSFVAEWVAREVAARTDALVAPSLNYGHSPTFRGFTGNLSLSARTLELVTGELIAALVESGFRRIVLVNNNGGNVGPVSSAAFDARRDLGVLIGHLYPWQLGYALMRDLYDDPATAYGHGAEPEHSAMLAMFPELVQSDRVESGGMSGFDGWRPTSYNETRIGEHAVRGTIFWDFSEVSPTGVSGDPRLADAETGKLWIERVVGFCADYVAEYDRNTRADSAAGTTEV
ncbi:creatinine amidohydrolase [Murinocardiopsis flavida]|uniref:Creatinine amidohydrolase n=1 Tax=Murinocardiopsis flavida TaxID=645275 RepID=A0A2P8DSU9_9ACTN|nr:creatininase family protein [Murinocardiopsis flavida]PSL00296.1 creatinine amidohydrolase [Murinocardiopsis flavida]